MENIKITLPEVSASASNIRSINANLDEVLGNITKHMNDLSSVWQGTAGETIVTKFQKFTRKFMDESETIEEYAKYLDYVTQTYDSLESTLTSNASNFE